MTKIQSELLVKKHEYTYSLKVQKADIRRISGRTDLPGQRFSIDQDNSHFEKHDMFKFLKRLNQSLKDPQNI